MTARRLVVPIYAALCVVGLLVGALLIEDRSAPEGYDSFPWSAVSFVEGDDDWTVYDDDEVYWVFSHREQLCAEAEQVGADGVVVSVLEAGAITVDEVMYLRGMLRGCA